MSRTPFLKTLAEEHRRLVEQNRRRMVLAREHRRLINSLLACFPDETSPSVSITEDTDFYEGATVTISIWGSVFNLSGFKDPKLCRTLEALLRRDMDVSSKDFPEYINREYHFRRSFEYEGKPKLVVTVCVNAFVNSESPTCKKVKVGTTKTLIETDQYELRCS